MLYIKREKNKRGNRLFADGDCGSRSTVGRAGSRLPGRLWTCRGARRISLVEGYVNKKEGSNLPGLLDRDGVPVQRPKYVESTTQLAQELGVALAEGSR